MRTAVLITLALGLGVAFAASQDATESSWDVPAEAKAVPNPVENTPEAVEAGAALFKKYCVTCHGEAGLGDGKATKFIKPAPPDISTAEAKERLTDGEIFYKVSTGKRPMPAGKGKMSDTEIWQVVLYVRTLQVN